jgi:hypothetical protein
MKIFFTFNIMNDHYIKINKCIHSSKTTAQFESCEKLISNFKNLFLTKKGKNCNYTKKLVKNLIHDLSFAKEKLL